MNIQLKKGRRYECSIIYQIAWCTRDRQPIFHDPARIMQMINLLNEKMEEKDIEMLRVSVGEDYVYVMIETDPQTAPIDLIKMLKGGSAKRLQIQYPEICRDLKDNHVWDDKYLIVAGAQDITETVFDYVQRQKKR